MNQTIKTIEAQLEMCEETVRNIPKLLDDLKIKDRQNKLRETYFDIKNDLDDQLRTIHKKEFETAKDQCNEIKHRIKVFCNEVSDSIRADYNIDANTMAKDSLEMNKIFQEWWCAEWICIKQDFQSFFLEEIRCKLDPDAPSYMSHRDIHFKEIYNNTINTICSQIPATSRDYQKKIYKGCTENKVDFIIIIYNCKCTIVTVFFI
jgi:hypothetical protein